MFCPNCGAEYTEGIAVCSTCNMPLLDHPSDGIEPAFIKFVTVYETGDPAFIAFAKSIFQSEGIRYFVKGEGLQDLFAGGRLGSGFNPVIGPVEIQVDEKDAEKAKDLLSQIEQGEFKLSETDAIDDHTEQSEYSPAKKYKVKGLLMGFTIGIFVSAIAFYLYDYREKHFSGVLKYDRNRDLKPDLFYTYKNGTVVSEEEDRNFDGKIDLWIFYKDGNIDRAQSDNNFDGRVDTWYYYKNGVATRVEIDTNFDNKPEIIEECTNGVLSAMSWYHESSRNLWKKAYYVGGIKKEEYIDKDYDGSFDIKIIYDSSERVIRTDSLH